MPLVNHRKETLLSYFQQDHAVLGSGFHRLSVCLRTGDVDDAQHVAQQLDEFGEALRVTVGHVDANEPEPFAGLPVNAFEPAPHTGC